MVSRASGGNEGKWGRLVLSYQLVRKLSRLKGDQPHFRGFCYGYPNHRAPRRRGLFSLRLLAGSSTPAHHPGSNAPLHLWRLGSSYVQATTFRYDVPLAFILSVPTAKDLYAVQRPRQPLTLESRERRQARKHNNRSLADDLIRAERTRGRAEDYHCTRAVRLQYDSSTTTDSTVDAVRVPTDCGARIVTFDVGPREFAIRRADQRWESKSCTRGNRPVLPCAVRWNTPV
jgi:hypothetical protein